MDPELFGVQSIAYAFNKRVVACGAESPQDYVNRLTSDAVEFQELLEDLLVPETWMFRDAIAFSSLGRFFSIWLSNHREPIRILSVACSTGEEVYSLAISLREAGFDPSRFQILGIELSRRALELAIRGELNPRSFREPDDKIAAMRERWCDSVGQSWQVRDVLHEGVDFKWGNLAQSDFLADESPFNVIFCRNVLIYFHAEARRTAVRNLHRLLSADGILYSAPAEARVFSDAGFQIFDNQCPFAFRYPPALADTTASAAVVTRPQEKNVPLIGVSVELRKPAPLHAVRHITSSESIGRDSSKDYATNIGLNTNHEEPARQDMLLAARQAANYGRLQEADELCGQILALDPANTEAHYLRGVVFQAQGLISEAQRSLEKALYLDPKHYQALVHMMLLSEQRGDQNAMANYQRRARQVAPREDE
jgi:chemotaxis protein methyltransferase WspC